MPIKSGKTTAAEKVFIDRMAATGDRIYAAKEAGYKQPARDAGRALSRPAVLAEIGRQQQERLFSEALPAAVRCLVEIISNSKAPAGARVQAAKVVMDRTLGMDDLKQSKEPHEMSGEELANAIAALERAAADKAKPIDAIEEPISASGADVFE
jgi:phage terminase small subunit